MIDKESEIKTLLINIVLLRRKYNLSKKKMAELIGTSIYSINKIEKGICPKRMKIDVLFKIQNNFNIPVYKLFK
ncbi:MAG: helix-turn-helix transcriptional regulator [Acutalibacteraceae bacterium]|nr:helix-turn-helix transcriptional regulator [Acutalibacteraceae bacterium]